jgi:hypothetical protein
MHGDFTTNSAADPNARELYDAMNSRAQDLCDAIRNEFPRTGIEVVFDINNNLVCFKKVERGQKEKDKATAVLPRIEFIHPLDRTHTPLSGKYTTKAVSGALRAYLSACEKLKQEVQRKLKQLCSFMVDVAPATAAPASAAAPPSSDSSTSYVGSVVQAAHMAVILNTALYHAYSSQQQGWTLPAMDPLHSVTSDVPPEGLRMKLKNLTPYWLPHSSAVKNDVDINGILLLTAPNMSGKSTVMRATLVAALLANCGLCIPAAEDSHVPRYDCYFMRTSSYDIPSEGKSAFGLEMDDMRVILRDSSPASLVMVDEIGKGTSSRDGAAIAGALLEYLDQRNVSGIFATHLHELLALPLETQRLHRRRMGMTMTSTAGEASRPQWTYRLEEGVCTDSMAIVTARAFGLPDSLVKRAEVLGQIHEKRVMDRDDPAGDSAVHKPMTVGGHVIDKGSCNNSVTGRPVTLQGVLQGVLGEYASQHGSALFSPTTAGVHAYEVVHIPHGSAVPAYLEGQSCLYVLDIDNDDGGGEAQTLYVGESDSIAQRIQTHKR